MTFLRNPAEWVSLIAPQAARLILFLPFLVHLKGTWPRVPVIIHFIRPEMRANYDFYLGPFRNGP